MGRTLNPEPKPEPSSTTRKWSSREWSPLTLDDIRDHCVEKTTVSPTSQFDQRCWEELQKVKHEQAATHPSGSSTGAPPAGAVTSDGGSRGLVEPSDPGERIKVYAEAFAEEHIAKQSQYKRVVADRIEELRMKLHESEENARRLSQELSEANSALSAAEEWKRSGCYVS